MGARVGGEDEERTGVRLVGHRRIARPVDQWYRTTTSWLAWYYSST